MTTVVFTTNSGGGGDDILGIRANYDHASDTLTVDNAVLGLGGNDSVSSALLPIAIGDEQFSFAITVDGGEGNDSVTGYNATDILIGGGGDDTVNGAVGSSMSGGSGIDTLNLDSHVFAGDIFVSYAAQAGAAVTLADGSTIGGFEKFQLQTGAGNDTIDLSGDANALDSLFFCFDGDDTLKVDSATRGSIAYNSGDGIDRLVADLSGVTSFVEVQGNASGPGGSVVTTGLTAGGNDLEILEVTAGSADDLLNGGSFADMLAGSGGTDTLNGWLGDDRLDGGTGVDTMTGGDGGDTYVVDTLSDILTEAAGGGTDTVETALLNYSLLAVGNIERILYTGAGNFVGRGNGFDNRIQGAAGNDRFVVDPGGADRYFGEAGAFDQMDFRLSATGAIVNLTTGVHGGAASSDFFSSIEAFYGSNTAGDSLTGGTFNDRLDGYGGNDTLAGLGGNDTLMGGDGDDEISGGALLDFLYGNAGADDFNYADVSDSGPTSGARDRIYDFAAGSDDIDVSAIDARAGNGGNNAFTGFIGSAAFTAEGQVRWYQSGANTVIEFNTTGTSGAEMQIQLQTFTAATLAAGDFIG